MNRRTMIGSLASAPAIAWLANDQTRPAEPSLYIPKAHEVSDRAFLHDFMDEFSFVELVTATPALHITHIPVVLDRTTGQFGTVFGHVSAQNPQHDTFDGAHATVIVFRGPHGYISPTWYAKRDAVVPTWNFAVVHASGRPRVIAEPAAKRALLARLIAKHEGPGSAYDFSALPDDYVLGMMKGITAFSMEIESLEGKFKLGQERSEGDRAGILEHLQSTPYRERSLHDLTEAFYRRGK